MAHPSLHSGTKATFTAALLLLGLSACDDATGPELGEAAIDADLAALVAQSVIQDVQDMSVDLGGPTPAGPIREFTGTRTITFYNADGQEMDGYDRLLTESVNRTITLTGTIETDRWSASIGRTRDITVSGLLGEETERRWNGVGTEDVTRNQVTDEFGERSYTLDADLTISDVVVALPRSENPYPLSGTITHHVLVRIVSADGERTRERTFVITFNGTRYATLTVNGETFEIDLEDRSGDRPHRRR